MGEYLGVCQKGREAVADKSRNEELQKKLQEITNRLEQGVQDVFTSENYKKYLAAISKFHNYPLNNILLIAMQKPDSTLVVGYNAWKKLHGRQVRRGEKGIKILAPAPYTANRDIVKRDPKHKNQLLGRMENQKQRNRKL